jgi:hypothetical protein
MVVQPKACEARPAPIFRRRRGRVSSPVVRAYTRLVRSGRRGGRGRSIAGLYWPHSAVTRNPVVGRSHEGKRTADVQRAARPSQYGTDRVRSAGQASAQHRRCLLDQIRRARPIATSEPAPGRPAERPTGWTGNRRLPAAHPSPPEASTCGCPSGRPASFATLPWTMRK